jgi:hypothetical protein
MGHGGGILVSQRGRLRGRLLLLALEGLFETLDSLFAALDILLSSIKGLRSLI